MTSVNSIQLLVDTSNDNYRNIVETSDLYLSHWHEKDVKIPNILSKRLKEYQILAIRFLFDCFQKKKPGVILNQDEHMGFQVPVAAFLRAIFPQNNKNNILILCPISSIVAWHYHMKIAGFACEYFHKNGANRYSNATYADVVILDYETLTSLKSCDSLEYFCVVAENLELTSTKRNLKKLKSNFKIGLTFRNFFASSDPKTQWAMLKWVDPINIENRTKFIEEAKEHLDELRDVNQHIWHRLTWKYCDTFQKPSDEENKDYNENLEKWKSEHNINLDVTPPKKRSHRGSRETSPRIKNKKVRKIQKSKIFDSESQEESKEDPAPQNNIHAEYNKTLLDNAELADFSSKIVEDLSQNNDPKQNSADSLKSEDNPILSIMKNTSKIKLENNDELFSPNALSSENSDEYSILTSIYESSPEKNKDKEDNILTQIMEFSPKKNAQNIEANTLNPMFILDELLNDPVEKEDEDNSILLSIIDGKKK